MCGTFCCFCCFFCEYELVQQKRFYGRNVFVLVFGFGLVLVLVFTRTCFGFGFDFFFLVHLTLVNLFFLCFIMFYLFIY